MNGPEQPVAALDHAWRYFELHAKQRMSVFNFFLALSGVVAAGLVATLREDHDNPFLGIVFGCLLCIVSFVFWKLDQRVSFLIKHAEAALAECESAYSAESTRLFSTEATRATEVADRPFWWARHWTYGKCFRLVYWVMALVGIGGASLAAFRVFGAIMSTGE